MKIVLRDVAAQVWVNHGDHEPTDVLLTIEIDLDRIGTVATKAYWSRTGEATWVDRAISALGVEVPS